MFYGSEETGSWESINSFSLKTATKAVRGRTGMYLQHVHHYSWSIRKCWATWTLLWWSWPASGCVSASLTHVWSSGFWAADPERSYEYRTIQTWLSGVAAQIFPTTVKTMSGLCIICIFLKVFVVFLQIKDVQIQQLLLKNDLLTFLWPKTNSFKCNLSKDNHLHQFKWCFTVK